MRRLYAALENVAPTPLPVLILGDTGTGKEVAAEWLHRCSGKPADRFVKVNCASLCESLSESELFGHERGAFTGALAQRAGLFEAADSGTLFLDEIAELPLRIQAKILRVLECGELARVGSTRTRAVEVRVVAATHRDLEQLILAGQFREDLYFRLNGITFRMPPLRERPSEIVPLAEAFIARFARRLERRQPRLEPCALDALHGHDWPGNVRELRQVVERAVVLCNGLAIEAEHVLVTPRTGASPRSNATSRSAERERILEALAQTQHNQTRAAELLGVSRRTLTNKLNAHAIPRPRKRVFPEGT